MGKGFVSIKLEIVGAGFGRTGTQSLKIALDQLGVGPCYHMMEVFGKTDHIAMWAEATRGEAPRWDVLFEGYRSTVDWPGCAFWRELAAAYPEAKVLLSVRDAESWYESFRETIYQGLTRPLPPEPAWLEDLMAVNRELIFERALRGRPDDRASVIRCFEEHNEAVRSEVPAERLILYEVGSGWAPLCKALTIPIPDDPYPRTNSTQEFRERMSLGAR